MSRDTWNTDRLAPLADEQWRYFCAQSHVFSPNYRLHLIHFKSIHRLYRTPEKLFRMGLIADAAGIRCSAPSGDYLHLAWDCPEVSAYWAEVIVMSYEIMGHAPKCTPLVALLDYVNAFRGAQTHGTPFTARQTQGCDERD